jgi:hypothetical protein
LNGEAGPGYRFAHPGYAWLLIPRIEYQHTKLKETQLDNAPLSIAHASREISTIVAAALVSYHASSNKTLRAYLNEVINFMCRRMEEFVQPRVSKAAQAEAKKRGVPLASLRWRQQSKWDPGRKIFHLDHCFDVRTMRTRLLALTEPTPANVEGVLKLAQIAWILKEEDRKLTSTRRQHSRGDEWPRIYREATIDLEE